MGWFGPERLRSKDDLVETICAITWNFEGGSVSAMDELRVALDHEDEIELLSDLAELVVGGEASAETVAEYISEMFPAGRINGPDSDYSQWGGTVPEDDGSLDVGDIEDHYRDDGMR